MFFLASVIIGLIVIAALLYRETPLWLSSGIILLTVWVLGFISPAWHSMLLWLPILVILAVLNMPAWPDTPLR